MTADPIPHDSIFVPHRQGAVLKAQGQCEPSRCYLTLQLLEAWDARDWSGKDGMSAWHLAEYQPETGKQPSELHVVRDCIKAGHPSATCRPAHLPEWLPAPFDGSPRAFRHSVPSKRSRRLLRSSTRRTTSRRTFSNWRYVHVQKFKLPIVDRTCLSEFSHLGTVPDPPLRGTESAQVGIAIRRY